MHPSGGRPSEAACTRQAALIQKILRNPRRGLVKINRSRRSGRGAAALATAIIAASMTMTAAGPAAAAPYNCGPGGINLDDRSEFWIGCTSGSGQFRAVATCTGFTTTGQLQAYTSYGPWRNPGSTSFGDCDRWYLIGERVIPSSIGAQTRN
jgi:hypothetical protein